MKLVRICLLLLAGGIILLGLLHLYLSNLVMM